MQKRQGSAGPWPAWPRGGEVVAGPRRCAVDRGAGQGGRGPWWTAPAGAGEAAAWVGSTWTGRARDEPRSTVDRARGRAGAGGEAAGRGGATRGSAMGAGRSSRGRRTGAPGGTPRARACAARCDERDGGLTSAR